MATNTNGAGPRRLAVGVVGIGRIGRQHALNALHNAPRTQLVCACSPAAADLEWAAEHLEPYGVRVYRTFEELLAQPGLEAVVIASTTTVHHAQVKASLAQGLHVLCEKPLAMNVAEARDIAALAARPAHRAQRLMTAFSRRFDDSYLQAAAAVREGRIGTPVVVRSETRDMYDESPFYRRYVMANPGVFIDTAVHDIDLTLAFLGGETRPKSVQAIGNIALHKDLAQIADVDNAVGIVEWYPPTAGATAPISYYYFSRIMRHGFDNPTEIIGTDGVLKINLHPRRDLIVSANANGIGNDVMPDFYERYEKAFVTELRVFADCLLDERPLPYEIDVAIKGMEIAAALQESLRTGVKIEWSEDGKRIENSSKL
jgi:myo-inositol 2-dehydrogenase / D-chiro-inositol 1-dehydrogenase